MYTPEAFRETDIPTLHRWIRQYGFGTLVSWNGAEPIATHLPFLLDAERGDCGTLLCHLARANPQWKSMENGAEVLAMFQGPHAYVSPSWYVGERNVPTWLYVAVHAYGTPRLIHDPDELLPLVGGMVGYYEAALPEPWTLERPPKEYIERLARGIVGVEIPISRLEGKAKLNQGKPEADMRGVIAALESGGEPMGVEIARLMRTYLKEGD